jgi:hypothetical protein
LTGLFETLGLQCAMSERSIYLRDQADKCRAHARAMTDPETQTELRKLADEYIARAALIESKE